MYTNGFGSAYPSPESVFICTQWNSLCELLIWSVLVSTGNPFRTRVRPVSNQVVSFTLRSGYVREIFPGIWKFNTDAPFKSLLSFRNQVVHKLDVLEIDNGKG